jgi:DNA repair protein RecO (recombination protein O)
MHIVASAIVLAARAHGEHGVIVRVLTADHGLLAGYVRAGRSRRVRPILTAGNVIAADFRARNETQLPSLSVEPILSRAALSAEPLAAAAIEWVTALAAVALPEAHPYPGIHATLDAILVAIESAPSARGWVPALVQYEALILAELGYGSHAKTLDQTGDRLRGDLLTGRRADILPARARLIDRIDRAMGR